MKVRLVIKVNKLQGRWLNKGFSSRSVVDRTYALICLVVETTQMETCRFGVGFRNESNLRRKINA